MATDWPSKEKKNEFFEDLRALIAKHPNLADRMARENAEVPICIEEHDDGTDQYDPDSPVLLEGIVVLLSFTNLERYENLIILDPYEQSSFMTNGMLNRAVTVTA